jgi:transcriptional regulator with AAA-type ATPase domain
LLPGRRHAEREALGVEFVGADQGWHVYSANVPALNEQAQVLVDKLRVRLGAGAAARDDERQLYEDLVCYVVYHRYITVFEALVAHPAKATQPISAYDRFAKDLTYYLDASVASEIPHLWGLFFQLLRAFHFTFEPILGGSPPAARLRAAVWQSIFTHDLRRYRRALHRRMADVTTLITGPSGTGKELVARAIGLSRYVPFDPARHVFVENFMTSFLPLHLSALPSTLVESELFGHCRGTFTGAVQDREGWLEVCPRSGTVFLDEVGEIDLVLQVKLLRVIQERTFHRLGDTQVRRFGGKLIAATNRDLAAEIAAGRFREDLYYRLCADVIATPSLEEQLRAAPDELGHLLRHLADRIVGTEEAQALAEEAHRWVREHLAPDYPWPGNVRELEQCLRNIMVRGEYRPGRTTPPPDATPKEALTAAVAAGTLTVDDLVRRYCALIYLRTGSYQETARRVGLDRRTVKANVEAAAGEAVSGL